MKKLAVFVSGRGSNFRKIHEGIEAGDIPGEETLAVSNNPDCPAADFARDHGIDVYHYPRSKDHPAGELLAALRDHAVDFVVLAGYIKLVPAEVVRAYPRAMLNIHPALLPAFGGKGYYGHHVHEAVIASGAKYSGVSVHFVDELYDHGPIVAQKVVPVLPDDTPDILAQRVLKEEHQIYRRVVAALCRGDIVWRDDGVPYIRHDTSR